MGQPMLDIDPEDRPAGDSRPRVTNTPQCLSSRHRVKVFPCGKTHAVNELTLRGVRTCLDENGREMHPTIPIRPESTVKASSGHSLRSGNGADGLGIEPRSTAISSLGRCCALRSGAFRSRCVAM